jgi:hypothetical protein
MVEFVHPLAWAVTAEDAAKAITSRRREMRNFMLPPKFVGVAFSLTRIRAGMLLLDHAANNGERL